MKGRTWVDRGVGFVLTLGLLSLGTALFLDRCVMPAYTRHGKEVFLPEVVGMPLPEAVETLTRRGIPVDRVDTLPSTLPEGTVIRQDPHGGMRIKEGRGVRLFVSGGERF